jgi:hypothetical protein
MDGQGIQTLSLKPCAAPRALGRGQTSANNLFMRGLLAEGKPTWMVCAFILLGISATLRKHLCIGGCRGAERPGFDSLLPGVWRLRRQLTCIWALRATSPSRLYSDCVSASKAGAADPLG